MAKDAQETANQQAATEQAAAPEQVAVPEEQFSAGNAESANISGDLQAMLQAKMNAQNAAAPAPAAVAAPVVEEASNDDELAAVISAAIAAYEAEAGGSTDGFVVRSIKRRPSNKWHA